MTPGECMYCGLNPAEGYACVTQNGKTSWYCHGDDEGVSCYERRNMEITVPSLEDAVNTVVEKYGLKVEFKENE